MKRGDVILVDFPVHILGFELVAHFRMRGDDDARMLGVFAPQPRAAMAVAPL